ncbi:MAG TPA: serine protease [Verrucomicrobiae bacterium]|nr:serine protease [Verrucomicrobiae bacterium]
MRPLFSALIALAAVSGWAAAQPGSFVIDDDKYSDRVLQSAERLLQQHRLVSLQSLQQQVRRRGTPLNLLPVSREKLEPPELCERLRESTLAVGTFYKCPDCGNWHFSSSSGFVAAEGGVISTCCHVIITDDKDVKEAYLVAADSSARVYPVEAVLAADTRADTCLLRITAPGLRPLPFRTGARPGEMVYCLSHPGGYFFMFTQGMISRLNRRTNADAQDLDGNPAVPSRPVLMLNITAEFAPGSSGAAVVDGCGNVVGQVASIADAGEPASPNEDDAPASPSVPVRFCTASEEILPLTNPNFAKEFHAPQLRPAKKPKSKTRQLQ